MAPKVRIVSTVNLETNAPLPRVVKTTIKSSAARLCFRTRCLKYIRLRLDDLLFFHVASYAPASCHLGFAEGEEDCMVKICRQSIHERHWLASHVDHKYERTTVSPRALAEAILPHCRYKAPLDADGVYALSALCDLTAPSNISGSEDEEVQRFVYLGEHEFPKTPLASALEIQDKAILRLLLHYRADPNGYQWHFYVPNGPSERLREAQKSSYNPSFKTDRFCYQTSKQLLHFVVRSVSVHFGSLPSSSDVRLSHSPSNIWIDRRPARAHLSVSEARLD